MPRYHPYYQGKFQLYKWQVSGTVFQAKYQVFRCQVSGTKYQVPGTIVSGM